MAKGNINVLSSRLFSQDNSAIESAFDDFIKKYKGYTLEKGNTGKFWCELLEILQRIYKDTPEIADLDIFNEVKFEDKIEGESVMWADATIECSKTLIEQKKSDISLDEKIKQSDGSLLTPYEQALRYEIPCRVAV